MARLAQFEPFRSILKRRTVRPASRPNRRRNSALTIERLEDRLALSGTSFISDLNAIGAFSVFGLNGAEVVIRGPKTLVGGDVGIGPYGIQTFARGTIGGSLFVDPLANNSHHNKIKGSDGQPIHAVPVDLSALVASAVDAASQVSSAAPTQIIANIATSTTISAQAANHVNVVQVGNIHLAGAKTLTLSGGANDYFLFNVTGAFDMQGHSAILLQGGVGAGHVIFNIVGSGEKIVLAGHSIANGTFLAIDRDIVDRGATVNGALIGGRNHDVLVTAGAQIQTANSRFDPSGLRFPVLAIDAGGAAAGGFVADTGFTGGDVAYNLAPIDTSQVTNPAPQSVYQTIRFGDFSYTFANLAAGSEYIVQLDFAEIFATAAGQRVFSVNINGAPVLSNFDIYAAAGGRFIALAKAFPATADAYGNITIQFQTVLGSARVNGIELFSSNLLGVSTASGTVMTTGANPLATGSTQSTTVTTTVAALAAASSGSAGASNSAAASRAAIANAQRQAAVAAVHALASAYDNDDDDGDESCDD